MTQPNKNISNALFKAYRSRRPIDFVSESYQISEEEAYLNQDDLLEQLKFKDNTLLAIR